MEGPLILYFDKNPDISRSVAIQHDGISVKSDAVWTKDNSLLGIVPEKTTLSHVLLDQRTRKKHELADSAEVYMVSIVQYAFKIVVQVDPCSSSTTGLTSAQLWTIFLSA